MSKIKSNVLSYLSQVVRCTLPMLVVGLLVVPAAGQIDAGQAAVRVNLTQNGALAGRVVTMLDSEETPVVARVSLTADGKTVATSTTDIIGNFSFDDVKPGTYEMVGVSGQYVGGQSIVVGEAVEGGENSVELRVSTAATVAPIANAPLSALSPVQAGACSSCAPVASSCSSCASPASSCSTCGGGVGGGIGGRIGGGAAFGGSSSLRRLLLIGGAVAIPVAISGDGGASPDQ